MRAPRALVSGATSFAAIYHDQFEYAWACLRRLGVPPGAQEDALQDLFLVVHRRLPEFAGRSSLKTWIFGVARRVAARHRRTEARRQRRHARIAAASAHEPLPGDGDDELARRDARRRLAEFLDRLDDDRRAVFVLHLYEEMSAPEIARALGVNVNTVYSRIRLAREQFDRAFGDPAQVRAATAPEPAPAGAQRRVWAALVMVLGSGAAAAAPGLGLAAGAGAAAQSGMAWALGLATAALALVAVAPRAEPSTSPARADVSATRAAADPSRPAAAHPDESALVADRSTPASPSSPAASAAPAHAPGRTTAIPPAAPRPPANASSPTPATPPAGPPANASTFAPAPPPAALPANASTPAPVIPPAPLPANASTPAARPGASSPRGAAIDRLAAEARLIADVRAAIDGGRLADALAGLRRHRREFPDGVLQPERRGLQALALCRGERTPEGRRAAAEFLAAHPDSALAARVRLDCDLPADGENSPAP